MVNAAREAQSQERTWWLAILTRESFVMLEERGERQTEPFSS